MKEDVQVGAVYLHFLSLYKCNRGSIVQNVRSWHGKNSGAIISVPDYALAVPILSASLKQV